MKKSIWVLLLFFTPSTESFCQINLAAAELVAMISRETAKKAFPLYYAFDHAIVTGQPLKVWKKKLNHQFDSLSKEIAKHETFPELYSTDAEAYLHRGIAILYNPKSRFNSLKERCEESIPDFTLALKYHPDDKAALILRGFANYYLEANEAAIVDLTAATELTPKKQIAFILLGKVYIETKQLQMACDTFVKARENGFEVPEKLFKQSCGKKG